MPDHPRGGVLREHPQKMGTLCTARPVRRIAAGARQACVRQKWQTKKVKATKLSPAHSWAALPRLTLFTLLLAQKTCLYGLLRHKTLSELYELNRIT
jgi:hypothetical protein